MKERGFSLTEVLAAVMIVSIGMLALIGARIYALKTSTKSTERHTASVLATTCMAQAEELIDTDFTADVAAPRQKVPTQPGFEYARAQDASEDHLKKVTVSVYWTDQNGPQEYLLWTKLLEKQEP